MFGIEIDSDYLKNKFEFDNENISVAVEKANLLDTHWNVYGYVEQEMFCHPNIENIADYINNGKFKFVDNFGLINIISCNIADAEKRIDRFKRAIANQYIYDTINGRSSMVNDEFTVCEDSRILLKNLGLLRKTFNSRR